MSSKRGYEAVGWGTGPNGLSLSLMGNNALPGGNAGPFADANVSDLRGQDAFGSLGDAHLLSDVRSTWGSDSSAIDLHAASSKFFQGISGIRNTTGFSTFGRSGDLRSGKQFNMEAIVTPHPLAIEGNAGIQSSVNLTEALFPRHHTLFMRQNGSVSFVADRSVANRHIDKLQDEFENAGKTFTIKMAKQAWEPIGVRFGDFVEELSMQGSPQKLFKIVIQRTGPCSLADVYSYRTDMGTIHPTDSLCEIVGMIGRRYQYIPSVAIHGRIPFTFLDHHASNDVRIIGGISHPVVNSLGKHSKEPPTVTGLFYGGKISYLKHVQALASSMTIESEGFQMATHQQDLLTGQPLFTACVNFGDIF